VALGICLLLAQPVLGLQEYGWPAVRTVAGTGTAGFSGNGGSALSAQLSNPSGIAVAADGTVYIADTGNDAIRKVGSDGTIASITATADTGLSQPRGLALSIDGEYLYVADAGHHKVRRITLANNTMITVAGTGTAGYVGNSGAATAAQLTAPWAVAVDSTGRLFIADSTNSFVRMVDAAGIITRLAGTPAVPGSTGDGSAATTALLKRPVALAVRRGYSMPKLFVADGGNYRVRFVDDLNISRFAGADTTGALHGDLGQAADAGLGRPTGVFCDVNGNVYISDSGSGRIRRVDGTTGVITTFAGGGTLSAATTPGVAALSARLNSLGALAVSGDEVYFCEPANHRVSKVYLRPSPVQQPTVIDYSGNGTVDAADLDSLRAHYGQRAMAESDPGRKYDLNGDGLVNYFDYILFFDNLGIPAASAQLAPFVANNPGANASAVWAMTPTVSTDSVAGGVSIPISFTAKGLAGVRQFTVALEYYPIDALDSASVTFTGWTGSTVMGSRHVPAKGVIVVGAGVGPNSADSLTGSQALGTLTVRTSAAWTQAKEITIRVVSLTAGKSATQSVILAESALGLAVRVNPLLRTLAQRRRNVFPNEPYTVSVKVNPSKASALSYTANIRPDTAIGRVDTVALRDNGSGADRVASDGIYSGSWTPSDPYLHDAYVDRYMVDLWPNDPDGIVRPTTAALSFLVSHTLIAFPDSMLVLPDSMGHVRLPLLIEDDGQGFDSAKRFASLAFEAAVTGGLGPANLRSDTVGTAIGASGRRFVLRDSLSQRSNPYPASILTSSTTPSSYSDWLVFADDGSGDTLANVAATRRINGASQQILAFVDVDSLDYGDATPMNLALDAAITPEDTSTGWALTVEALKADPLHFRHTVAAAGGQLALGRGDVDTSRSITSFDAALVLMHTVGRINLDNPNDVRNNTIPSAPGLRFSTYADTMADVSGRRGITALDASYILQRDARLISYFPAEANSYRLWDVPTTYWQVPSAISKPVATEVTPLGRVVSLSAPELAADGGQIIAAEIDEMQGVLAGTLTFQFDPKEETFAGVQKTQLTEGYQFASHVSGNMVRISFAAAVTGNGSGPIAELIFRPTTGSSGQLASVQLLQVQLNEEEAVAPASGVALPKSVMLSQNYPNPFNPSTTITYALPRAGQAQLEVYNLVGQRVRTLVTGRQDAGIYRLTWDGRDEQGHDVASGVYLCRLTAESSVLVRKMALVK
jgi:sugar lactone lactonase YvrE